MIAVTIISFLSTSIVIGFHFWSILYLRKIMPSKKDHNHFFRSFLILEGIFAVHLLEILFYAVIYYATSEWLNLGDLGNKGGETILNYIYFSISTYSTLGLTQFYPQGAIKILTGMESLTGFIMITWSASFFFSIVHQNKDK